MYLHLVDGDKYLFVVEGETDFLILANAGFSVAACPGVTLVDVDRLAEVAGGRKIVVWREPGHGGDLYFDKIVPRFPGRAFVIDVGLDVGELAQKFVADETRDSEAFNIELYDAEGFAQSVFDSIKPADLNECSRSAISMEYSINPEVNPMVSPGVKAQVLDSPPSLVAKREHLDDEAAISARLDARMPLDGYGECGQRRLRKWYDRANPNGSWMPCKSRSCPECWGLRAETAREQLLQSPGAESGVFGRVTLPDRKALQAYRTKARRKLGRAPSTLILPQSDGSLIVWTTDTELVGVETQIGLRQLDVDLAAVARDKRIDRGGRVPKGDQIKWSVWAAIEKYARTATEEAAESTTVNGTTTHADADREKARK